MSQETDITPLLNFFEEYVSEERREQIEEVLAQRTRHVCLLLEDIHKEHNASAVVRTADCFGVQDVHIVEKESEYNVNPFVSMGAYKWVDVKRHPKNQGNLGKCIEGLKSDGYRIYATSPHRESIRLEEIPLEEPIALAFGNELHGLSEEALELADGHISIPMYGFTESYNLSVSAAICLYSLISRLRESDIPWSLTEKEKDELKLRWYKNSVNKPDLMEKEFQRRFTNK